MDVPVPRAAVRSVSVVLAHLTAQETRRLYRVGYDREQMVGLYRFLDWLLRLPTEVAAAVWQTIRAYKGEQAWCGGRGLMVHPPPGARMAAILRLT